MGPVKWFEYIVATLGGVAAGGLMLYVAYLVVTVLQGWINARPTRQD